MCLNAQMNGTIYTQIATSKKIHTMVHFLVHVLADAANSFQFQDKEF